MSSELKSQFRQLFDLPHDARAALAGLLLESLEPPADPDVRQAWIDEAERRLAEVEAGQVETIPWDEVRERLLRTR